MRRQIFAVLALVAGCAHTPPSLPVVDERARRWGEWAGRVEALPQCLPMEWAAAAGTAPPTFAPGDTVHLRGQLGLIEFDCRNAITELLLRGRWLPDADSKMTLSELDAAVGQAERVTCGSVLGLRTGQLELAIEAPFDPLRVWRQNDAEVFDALLSQTGAVVIGVIDAGYGSQAVLRPDRVCRAGGPPLVLERVPDGGQRWKVVEGLERLADLAGQSRTRRVQALRVLFDVSVARDRPRARKAAERLASEFGDRSRMEVQSRVP